MDLHEPDQKIDSQINRPISCLYGAWLIALLFFIAALIFPSERAIWVTVAVFVVGYGMLTLKNDRVTYDMDGITFYSVWGKAYHKNWPEVTKAEAVIEPLISRQFIVGPVLKIYCIEKKRNKETIVIYRFPYKYYVGIDEFLSFYSEHFG